MRNVVTDTQHDLNNIGSRSIVVQAFLQSPWRRQERRESDAALRSVPVRHEKKLVYNMARRSNLFILDLPAFAK